MTAAAAPAVTTVLAELADDTCEGAAVTDADEAEVTASFLVDAAEVDPDPDPPAVLEANPELDGALAVEPAPVVLAGGEAVNVAEYLEHWAAPALWACMSWETSQLEMRQGAALAPMAAWVGPHWQPMSVAAQPAALMALRRQSVWEGGVSLGWCGVVWASRECDVRDGTYGAIGLAFKVLGQGGAGSSEKEHGGLHGDVCLGFYGIEEQTGEI